MSNVKFVYLYRDGANYKIWDDVIFENPDNLSLDEIDRSINSSFLPDKLFIANQISIPEKFLFVEGNFTEHDHCYHEFDYIESCKEQPTDILNRSVASFLKEIRLASEQGWKAFDILEYVQGNLEKRTSNKKRQSPSK